MNFATHFPELFEDVADNLNAPWRVPCDWDLPVPAIIYGLSTHRYALLLREWGDATDGAIHVVVPISPHKEPRGALEVRSPIRAPFDGALELWNFQSLSFDDIRENFVEIVEDGGEIVTEEVAAALYDDATRRVVDAPAPGGLERGRASDFTRAERSRHMNEELNAWSKASPIAFE